MTYAKPFSEIPALVQKLAQRGLEIPDASDAAVYLRKVGYFRSGGYRYIFRTMLPEGEQDVRTRTFRSDRYAAGARLSDVQAFERFDDKLRQVCLAGVMDFEVRLRTAIAHVLAARDVHAHTSTLHLDGHECAKPASQGSTSFDEWEMTYKKATSDAKEEDFVAHLIVKYGTPIPTWALVEVLSFGSLPFLFELLQVEDRRKVAARFGVKVESRFSAWLRSTVDLRNHCAHSSRLFNRQLKRRISVIPAAVHAPLLDHLAHDYPASEQGRLYSVAAVLAYMLRSHEAGSNWHNTFKTQIGKLPNVTLAGATTPLVTPEHNMGFPQGWRSLPLWS